MSLKAKRDREVEELRELEKKAFGPRHGKTDFYEYLEAVWNRYLKWKGDNKRQARKKQLAKFYKVKLRKNTHPIRAIIDASSEQDADVKSEWTRALKYLEKNAAQIKKVGFRKFVDSNGGIAGCANKGAKRRATMKPKVRPK
jgi:hypothetical protein